MSDPDKLIGKDGGWFSAPHAKRLHYRKRIPARDDVFYNNSLCGAVSKKWEPASGREVPFCKRCQQKIIVEGLEDPAVQRWSVEIDTRVSVEDARPVLAEVPVEDLEVLIVLLKSQRGSDDQSYVVNNIREGTILALEKHIAEAQEKHAKAVSVMSARWSPPSKGDSDGTTQ